MQSFKYFIGWGIIMTSHITIKVLSTYQKKADRSARKVTQHYTNTNCILF